jgi:RNA polymerase sigma-70 factor (ECF subfamily)
MTRVAMAFVSRRAVAEEVVQETWLNVVRGLDGFEANSSLRTWIYAILGNCARRKGEQEQRHVPLSELASASASPSPRTRSVAFSA